MKKHEKLINFGVSDDLWDDTETRENKFITT